MTESLKNVMYLTKEARSLIQRAFEIHHPVYGFSTTSCQVYDTAWVSMISKSVSDKKQWLFPKSFQYLLKTQADDGSWGKHPGTKTAGILDTAAALLALLRHAKEPLQFHDILLEDIRYRIGKATESLRAQLAVWDDILTTNHIGVEIIVPALLLYLESEDSSLTFEFEGKEMLMSMNKAKLGRFNPESLYKKRPSSALHSLEAFISKINFDKIKHHLFNGSMLASPSSTAAYLIHASAWDCEAEAYLRHVSTAGSGRGNGGIPGTFSTAYFEFNWILSTLLRAGFSRADLECSELFCIGKIIIDGFQEDHGVIGFAPRAVDVDDTAKGLLSLRLLGMHADVSPDPMIAMFEAEDHFRTFDAERDPSFTSNCHVLLALLQWSDKGDYLPQIKKAVDFLCKSWWTCDGLIKDKWHLSRLYPTMLLVQGFTDLIWQAKNGVIGEILDTETISEVSICLFQACLRTMLAQDLDGSWKGQPEETSYAILILAEAVKLVDFEELQPQLASAISRGNVFLQSNDWKSPDHNWTSKTAYRATLVAEAYLLAAVRVGTNPIGENAASVGHRSEYSQPTKHMNGYLGIVRQTDLFSSVEPWVLRASCIESMMFVPLLRAQRLKVYDRDQMGVSNDSYLDIIPFTWIGCNNRSGTYVSNSLLYEMMILSMLGYQTDEFIEAIAAPAFANGTAKLHDLIDNIIDSQIVIVGSKNSFERPSNGVVVDGTLKNGLGKTNGVSEAIGAQCANGFKADELYAKSRHITQVQLERFVQHVLDHEHVSKASLQDQITLRYELRAFLHAHTTQINDNEEIARRGRSCGLESRHHSGRPFFDWVRTTAADHVACAYSFTFLSCLISSQVGNGHRGFPTVKENYLVQAAARHMATMCRMCNDIGSVNRDQSEGNMNSVDFQEFAEVPSIAEKKKALFELAEYERHCLMYTLEQLQEAALQSAQPPDLPGDFNRRKVKIVRFYADVTDFYDQIYIVRDLSSTIRQSDG